jgi:hypothetical protein
LSETVRRRLLPGILLGLALWAAGCSSPEDGRPRGGGPGADAGNYQSLPLPVPSKLDGSRPPGPEERPHE